MRRTILSYATLLAILIIGLKLAEHQFIIAQLPLEVYITLIAVSFAALGIWAGTSLTKGRTLNLPVSVGVGATPIDAPFDLSTRELEVLVEMAQGKSNREIADHLHISENTVKTHVSNILEKLQAKRRSEAVFRAQELGVITLSNG